MSKGATVKQLVHNAEDALGKFEYEQAEGFLRKALEVDQHDTKVMDMLADVLMELGNLEPAKDISLYSLLSFLIILFYSFSPPSPLSVYPLITSICFDISYFLKRSIEIAPDTDFEKYMSLGQLLPGNEAISCYKRGIEVMLAHRRQTSFAASAPPSATNPTQIDQQLCEAFCAIAELFLTDSCFEDNAEEECGKFIDAALYHNPSSPEVKYLFEYSTSY